MEIIIKKDDLAAVEWSGGTTTQLAIFPPQASYADRDFMWRVSTASVDAERSDFTPLPGVSRILMVLEGALQLTHNGSREVALHRFGQDSFPGDWKTESAGRVRDFNLMMKEGCRAGSIEALELFPGEDEAPRLHTAAGVHHRDSFTDITPGFTAEGDYIVSEVYYALTDVRLSGHEDILLGLGDVYMRRFGASDIPPKLHMARNAETPAVLVRASIFHESATSMQDQATKHQ